MADTEKELSPVSAVAKTSFGAPDRISDIVDKWWADNVAAFQARDWALMVEAKEDLKTRLK